MRRAYTPYPLRPQFESAIDHYFEVEAEIAADLTRRHELHKAHIARVASRLDGISSRIRGVGNGE